MISIEQNVEDKQRFEFNKPFKCIDLRFGHSNEVLPMLGWKELTILWLDYDGQLDSSSLEDVGLFCTKACSGSVIIVTVNAHADQFDQSAGEEKVSDFRLNRLKDQVGDERIPPAISGKDLNLKNKAKVLYRIISNEIADILQKRNSGLDEDEKISYSQLFHFTYQDGAKMLTVGGILWNRKDIDNLSKCEFKLLNYFRNADEPFNIGVPKLTFREIKYLDKLIPVFDQNGNLSLSISQNDLKELSMVPQEDITNYISVYRFFPHFAETEI